MAAVAELSRELAAHVGDNDPGSDAFFRHRAAAAMLWLFNIVGLLDLIYANLSTVRDHVDPTYLGVSYYLAVINVPAMVVVHVMIFAYLIRTPARFQLSSSG